MTIILRKSNNTTLTWRAKQDKWVVPIVHTDYIPLSNVHTLLKSPFWQMTPKSSQASIPKEVSMPNLNLDTDNWFNTPIKRPSWQLSPYIYETFLLSTVSIHSSSIHTDHSIHYSNLRNDNYLHILINRPYRELTPYITHTISLRHSLKPVAGR